MARQLVIPGKPIDVVTPDELAQLLRREFRETPSRSITASATERQDANGRASIEVYKVPDGMEFELGWVQIEVEGTSFLVPLLRDNAGAQLEVNDVARDFYYEDGSAAGIFAFRSPFRKEYGSGGAVRCQNGSVLSIRYAGGAGGGITATIGGRLYSSPTGESRGRRT